MQDSGKGGKTSKWRDAAFMSRIFSGKKGIFD